MFPMFRICLQYLHLLMDMPCLSSMACWKIHHLVRLFSITEDSFLLHVCVCSLSLEPASAVQP